MQSTVSLLFATGSLKSCCLLISRIAPKLLNWFFPNFKEGWVLEEPFNFCRLWSGLINDIFTFLHIAVYSHSSRVALSWSFVTIQLPGSSPIGFTFPHLESIFLPTGSTTHDPASPSLTDEQVFPTCCLARAPRPCPWTWCSRLTLTRCSHGSNDTYTEQSRAPDRAVLF